MNHNHLLSSRHSTGGVEQIPTLTSALDVGDAEYENECTLFARSGAEVFEALDAALVMEFSGR